MPTDCTIGDRSGETSRRDGGHVGLNGHSWPGGNGTGGLAREPGGGTRARVSRRAVGSNRHPSPIFEARPNRIRRVRIPRLVSRRSPIASRRTRVFRRQTGSGTLRAGDDGAWPPALDDPDSAWPCRHDLGLDRQGHGFGNAVARRKDRCPFSLQRQPRTACRIPELHPCRNRRVLAMSPDPYGVETFWEYNHG